jgi:XTP/dITP diphosphohydrolase
MNELILATSNAGKIKELAQLLAPIHCIAQTTLSISSAEETGLSFIENAIIKARHASLLTNKPALADDSGLVVPALDGEPGIYSARYAGADASDKDNIDLLLKKMAHLAQNQRSAYFYCALALVRHAKDPTPIVSTGIFHGVINQHPSGNEGFGYDPIFYVPEHQCTAAQLNATVKNTISHRAQALNQLHTLMSDFYES